MVLLNGKIFYLLINWYIKDIITKAWTAIEPPNPTKISMGHKEQSMIVLRLSNKQDCWVLSRQTQMPMRTIKKFKILAKIFYNIIFSSSGNTTLQKWDVSQNNLWFKIDIKVSKPGQWHLGPLQNTPLGQHIWPSISFNFQNNLQNPLSRPAVSTISP